MICLELCVTPCQVVLEQIRIVEKPIYTVVYEDRVQVVEVEKQVALPPH